jgi:hypothetical protein
MAWRSALSLSAGEVQKLKRLLYMEYTPAEIEAETGLSASTITRFFIPRGLPARKDSRRRYWIVGTEFSAWVMANKKRYSKLDKHHLELSQFYCLKCKSIFTDPSPTIAKIVTRRIVYMAKTVCPKCGMRSGKFIKTKDVENDQPG